MRKILKQVVPAPLKELIRRARTIKPPKGLIYSPYQPDKEWYVIPKTPPPIAETDEHGQAVPPIELWQGYNATLERYLAGGKRSIEGMLSTLNETAYEIAPGDRVLDFGCGGGA